MLHVRRATSEGRGASNRSLPRFLKRALGHNGRSLEKVMNQERTMKDLLDEVLDLPELETVIAVRPAFIKWLGGNHTAALLLSQIIYWAKQKDWFYKTHHEWYDETRLSAKQVRKALRLFEEKGVGVETDLRKVKNAPTLHYRLDIPRFRQWVNGCRASDSAKREQSDSSQRAQSTVPKGNNPMCPNGAMDSDQRADSIYTKNTDKDYEQRLQQREILSASGDSSFSPSSQVQSSDGLRDGQQDGSEATVDPNPLPPSLSLASQNIRQEPDGGSLIYDVGPDEVIALYRNARHVKHLNRADKQAFEEFIGRSELSPADLHRAMRCFLADDYWREKRFPIRAFMSQAAKYLEQADAEGESVPEIPAMAPAVSRITSPGQGVSVGASRQENALPEAVIRWNELVDEGLKVKVWDEYAPAAKLREASSKERFADNFETLAAKCNEHFKARTKVCESFEGLFSANRGGTPKWVKILRGDYEWLLNKDEQPKRKLSPAEAVLARLRAQQRELQKAKETTTNGTERKTEAVGDEAVGRT